MRSALALARRGLGNAWPNPAVGCVLVRDGRVVGRGWTMPGGRPHAETEALARAGGMAGGATAYLSLEPCSHHGETPPCAEALVEAGIARAVIAVEDPDPRVRGAGIAALREAGIAVEVGLCADEARALNAGFFLRVTEGRPLVTLKLATTLDGRIATHSGESRWITGPEARRHAHMLRARHDAVMVGLGTAQTDDPALTVRLPGMPAWPPVRVVADSHLALPLDGALVRTAAETPLWVLCRAGADRARIGALEGAGAKVIALDPGTDNRPEPADMLAALAARGITRVLIEGGSHLSATFLRAGLVDRVAWFRAPSLIGGDGLPAVQGFGVEALADAPGFVRTGLARLGADILESLDREA